jgi:hypothetical protein
VPLPAVNDTTVSLPSVVDDDVKPAPTVIVAAAVKNRKMTPPKLKKVKVDADKQSK